MAERSNLPEVQMLAASESAGWFCIFGHAGEHIESTPATQSLDDVRGACNAHRT
jgi:hypothetical protein